MVLGLGGYIAMRHSAEPLAVVSDDLTAAGWKWRHAQLPLAPTVEATTTPRPVAKAPKNKPAAPSTKKPASPATSTPQAQPQWPTTPPQPTKPTPEPTPTPTPAPAQSPVAGEERFSAYLTAYTYWDNTPPGSSDISNPIIHQKAGGTGTYSDPITVAVGHDMSTGHDVLDYPAGTKFYLPYLKKYFIVEDTCGDGNRPENGPCHTGYQGNPWIDLWIDGANGTKSATNRCAEDITEIHMIIKNPAANYAVVSGPIYNNGCAQQFGDTPTSL